MLRIFVPIFCLKTKMLLRFTFQIAQQWGQVLISLLNLRHFCSFFLYIQYCITTDSFEIKIRLKKKTVHINVKETKEEFM